MGRREGATRIAQTEKHTGMSTGSAAETRRQRGRWERRFRSSSAEKNSFPSTTRQKHTSADTPTDCPAFGNAHPDLFTERAGEMAHRPPPTFHPPRKSCWSDVQRGKHVSAFTTWRGACAHAFPQMSECSRKLLFFFFFSAARRKWAGTGAPGGVWGVLFRWRLQNTFWQFWLPSAI